MVNGMKKPRIFYVYSVDVNFVLTYAFESSDSIIASRRMHLFNCWKDDLLALEICRIIALLKSSSWEQ